MRYLPLRGDSMRLFTNISFLTALLAIFGSSVTAAIAVLAFGCSRFILVFIIPVSCLCYFLSLLIAHFIAQPLTELAQKTRAYREGDVYKRQVWTNQKPKRRNGAKPHLC